MDSSSDSGIFTKKMSDPVLSPQSRYHILLCISILIFAVSLLFRLLKLVLDPSLMRDPTLYLQWVESWHETGNYHFERLGVRVRMPVLTLWIMKNFMVMGFGAEIIGRSLALFFGAMIPVAGFFVAFNLTKKIRIALLTAILLVFHPDLVLYSIQPLRENFYVFFEAILFLVMIEAIRRKSIVCWGFCGFFVSLLSFCRYEGLEFCLIVPFVIAAICCFKEIKWKKAVASIVAFSIVFGSTSLFLLSLSNYDIGVISKLEQIRKVNKNRS